MSRTDDILFANEKPQWCVPVNPEGDAAYWRSRAEKAEDEVKEFQTEAIKSIGAMLNATTCLISFGEDLTALRDQTRWIPVSEQPTEDEYYLVWYGDSKCFGSERPDFSDSVTFYRKLTPPQEGEE